MHNLPKLPLAETTPSSASYLASLPVSRDTPDKTEGMTFTILRGVKPFLSGRPEANIIRERIMELSAGAKQCHQNMPEMSGFAEVLARLALEFPFETSD